MADRSSLTRSAGAYALLASALFLAVITSSAPPARAATLKDLEIYFIDVEGGQATLIVTPERHSLLIDTGFAGAGVGFSPGEAHQARDANRILAAAHDAGISRIDYLLITHFHPDHDGGVSELAQLLPIRIFIDHGAPNPEATATSEETKNAFDAYATVRSRAEQHLQPAPGDRLPLEGVDVLVVSSAGRTLPAPLPHAGHPNADCQHSATPARDTYENPRSTGVLVSFGAFRFLDVGDLSGQPLFDLVCPNDLIGPVDAYLVAHHGGPDVSDPAIFAALRPRVAIMNNGLKKGGALVTYQELHQVPGLENVWQLHRSAEAGDSNFAPQFIANLDEATAYWIKLTANKDGSFQVRNARTGYSRHYAARDPKR
jgi:beta-lactamase superfamily II metal-dependent hydrolase